MPVETFPPSSWDLESRIEFLEKETKRQFEEIKMLVELIKGIQKVLEMRIK